MLSDSDKNDLNEYEKKFRLKIELIPSSCWGKNLRKILGLKKWKKIRSIVFEENNNKCAVCGSEFMLGCHEIWEYDDTNHIQTLKGFVPHCKRCRDVTHIGFASVCAAQGKLDFDKVIEHFLKINRCDITSFERYRTLASTQWKERSEYEWIVDLGNYNHLCPTINEKNKAKQKAEEEKQLKDFVLIHLFNAAKDLLDSGDYEEALKVYDKIIEVNPKYAGFWKNKGIFLSTLQRPLEALECYDKGLQLDAKNAGIWYNKGFLLASLGRDKESSECLQRSIELDPKYA